MITTRYDNVLWGETRVGGSFEGSTVGRGGAGESDVKRAIVGKSYVLKICL